MYLLQTIQFTQKYVICCELSVSYSTREAQGKACYVFLYFLTRSTLGNNTTNLIVWNSVFLFNIMFTGRTYVIGKIINSGVF